MDQQQKVETSQPLQQPVYQQVYPQVYPQVHTQQQVFIVHQEEDNTQKILFFVGFLCCITWWVGACCLNAITPEQQRYKRFNKIGTVISVILLIIGFILYIVLVVAMVNTWSSAVAEIGKAANDASRSNSTLTVDNN